jgi:hypothetical protein
MLKWLLPMAVLAYVASTVSAGPSRDRDHDRLPDRWERKHQLSTTEPSAKRDPDRDRLKNRRELRLRTHPRRADTDGDQLRDGAEVRRFRTNPRKRDTDGDGFGDRCELRKGTNPRKRRSHPKRRCSASQQNSPQEPGRQVPPRPRGSSTACSDGVDNDGDRDTDMVDKGCNSPSDTSEAGGAGNSFGDSGSFHAYCHYSHSAMLDPIVFPGQNPAGHLHDFIGARDLNENSTDSSIRAEANNCRRDPAAGIQQDSDKSAYWVPALLVDNQPVHPTAGVAGRQIGVYYRTNRRWPASIEVPPEDFRAIAGLATGGPQSINGQAVYNWSCHGGVAQPPTSPGGFPLCNTPNLRLEIKFGDCWDGRSDSPNHRDHVTYSANVPGSPQRACPRSHPRAIPALTLQMDYPTRGGSTAILSTVTMGASGNQTTTHADWMNGWKQSRFQQLINDCLNVDRYCGGQDTPVPGHP